MISLINYIEAISACRDRSKLPEALLCSVVCLFDEQANVGIYSRNTDGQFVCRLFSGDDESPSAQTLWPQLLKAAHHDESVTDRVVEGRRHGAVMLHSSEIGVEPLYLVYDVDTSLAGDRTRLISTLAQIYGNQLSLIDYSELDTLTRLLNRKTFEEAFDRLLAPPEQDLQGSANAVDERRHSLDPESPAWLCVIDIDHFKRINDSFGHLFGDEVLLRMGNLLRRTFRDGDRLFRFGGEEFVVILNAANQAQAALAFNRLRQSVYEHRFPQVGQVTCSIGFTAVTEGDVPTDAIGRADEALYYAKDHGRNQVCCYEQLMNDGLIDKPRAFEAEPDFDIDALFG